MIPVKQTRLRIWIERVYAFDDQLYEVVKESPSVYLASFVILWAVVFWRWSSQSLGPGS